MWYINEKFNKGMVVEKKKDDGSIEITSKCYAYETLKQDIKALVDLNRKQKAEYAQRNITIPDACGNELKAFEHNLKNRVRDKSETN